MADLFPSGEYHYPGTDTIALNKKNTCMKRFVIDLRPLNRKCKQINLFIRSVEQNLNKLHGSTVYWALHDPHHRTGQTTLCIHHPKQRQLGIHHATKWMG